MAIIVTDMAGTVFKVLVAPGDDVTQGQDVVVLESMKMEVPVASTAAGRVVRVAVAEGDFVNEGDTLMELA
jgi:acetyl-CoA carboxylase biotin carboxyl carrier protein